MIGVTFVLGATGSVLLLASNVHGSEHLRDLLVGQILWVQPTRLAWTAGGLCAGAARCGSAARERLGRAGFYVLFARRGHRVGATRRALSRVRDADRAAARHARDDAAIDSPPRGHWASPATRPASCCRRRSTCRAGPVDRLDAGGARRRMGCGHVRAKPSTRVWRLASARTASARILRELSHGPRRGRASPSVSAEADMSSSAKPTAAHETATAKRARPAPHWAPAAHGCRQRRRSASAIIGRAQRLIEDGPVHGFVGRQSPGDLGELCVLERRDHAEVRVGRAELETRREVRTSAWTLQRVRFQRLRVVVELLSSTGLPPIFWMVAISASRWPCDRPETSRRYRARAAAGARSGPRAGRH